MSVLRGMTPPLGTIEPYPMNESDAHIAVRSRTLYPLS